MISLDISQMWQLFTISLIDGETGGQTYYYTTQHTGPQTPSPRRDVRMDHTTGWDHEKIWWENPPKSPWQWLCLTAYKLLVFQGTDMKLVMVWKILKRSLKWDQSGISSFIRSKVMSKTSEIMKEEGKRWHSRKSTKISIVLLMFDSF